MNDDNNREDSVRTTVRELVLYLLFLANIVMSKIALCFCMDLTGHIK